MTAILNDFQCFCHEIPCFKRDLRKAPAGLAKESHGVEDRPGDHLPLHGEAPERPFSPALRRLHLRKSPEALPGPLKELTAEAQPPEEEELHQEPREKEGGVPEKLPEGLVLVHEPDVVPGGEPHLEGIATCVLQRIL